jgi:putative peptidoglycan lipid II flippase
LTTKRQILQSASLIALITVVSRICGYLRDQRIALLLGTSPVADSFILAFRIPGLIRRMTSEGSLGASFIPVFAGYLRNRPRSEAWELARKVFWDLAVVLAVVSLAGVVFSKQLINLLTLFGGSSGRWDLAISLNRVLILSIVFIGLAALASAILNSLHVFGLPAAAPVLFNLVVIAFSIGVIYRPIVGWAPAYLRNPAIALAFGVLAGSVVQLAMQIPALVRRGMTFLPEVSLSEPGVRRIASLMGPSFFGMGVYQLNIFVDTIFATSSRMPSGSVASLYLADRVMQLVLGSYAIAMSTALLPAMSHQAAAGKWEEMKHTLGFSLRMVSFITIPAAIGLILLRHPIVQLLFQHGQFVAQSTTLTARALFFYSIGLPAFAAIKLIAPMYYSIQDTMTPARIGAYALGINIVLNATFLLFFFRTLSNAGPALASSLAAYFSFGALLLVFRKRHGRLGLKGVATSLSKMAVCAFAMALVPLAVLRWPYFLAAKHIREQALLLAAVIFASTTVYFGIAWLLRCGELGEFWLLLRRLEPRTTALNQSAI